MAPAENKEEEADTIKKETRKEAETMRMEGRGANVKGAMVTRAIDAAPRSIKRKNAQEARNGKRGTTQMQSRRNFEKPNN